MASVVLGRVGSSVRVDSDICVKTGHPTRERLTIRGSTIPGWVHLLLVVTVVGWIVAMALSSHRYRVEVPFRHEVHDRWRRWRAVAWVLIVLGLGAVVWLASRGDEAPIVPAVASVVGLVLLLANNHVHHVGVRRDADGHLLLTRVHPAAARAIRAPGAVWVRVDAPAGTTLPRGA